MAHEPGHEDHGSRTLATWIAIGAGVGVALGVAMDNLGLWLAIGVGIGVAIGVVKARK
jgi:hypothetical protein